VEQILSVDGLHVRKVRHIHDLRKELEASSDDRLESNSSSANGDNQAEIKAS
jgi:hypothetical protein